MTYYKATRPDGTDFHTGDIDYAEALASGDVVTHPLKSKRKNDAHYYLSVATTPTDCAGLRWPCRLFEVEPVGKVWVPDPTGLPNKVACKSLRVVRELDSVDALGPQGAQLRDLVGQAARLTDPQVRGLVAAWVAAGAAARAAAWDAAWSAAAAAAAAAAWDAAWDAAWSEAAAAARDAASGLQSRDLIGQHPGWDQAAYDLLTGPWRKVVGRIHPDDEELS
jgi:hypothetical protein